MTWPVSGRAVGSDNAAEDRMRNAKEMASRRCGKVTDFGQRCLNDLGILGLVKEWLNGPTTCIAEIPAVSGRSHVGCIDYEIICEWS